MILKQISAGGLRGHTFSHTLGRMSAIIGPNMSGKSRVLDGILLALIGHIPGKDKTNPGIFRTASGNAMNVSAILDDPEIGQMSVERAWMQKADGTINGQKSIPSTFPAVPLVMFDAYEYFNKSEEQRLRMVFERMNLDDIPTAARIAKVVQAVDAAGLKEAKALLNSRQYAPAPSENYQQWLERALGMMAALAKEEKDAAKRMEQTVQGLTQLALDNPTALPDETVVRASIEEGRAQFEVAQQNLGAARRALQDNSGTAQRVAALERGIAERRNRTVELPTLEATMAQLQAELERHQAKGANAPTLREKQRMFTHEVAGHKATMEAATAELERIDAQEQEIISQKCCPTCKANRPTWKDAARKMFEEQRVSHRDKLTAAEAALKQAQTDLEGVGRELLIADAANAAAQTAQNGVQQAQGRINAAKADAEAMQRLQAELDELKAQGHGNSEELAESVVHAEQAVESHRTNLATAEQQLRAIEGARADAQKLTAAQKQREDSHVRMVQITEGARVLQQNRDGLMLDAFKPLLGTANLFAAGILKTPLEYRKGELGRVDENNPARWISQAFFSGLELATMHCAISAALGSQSPIRLVLIDELGRLDSANKIRFLLNAQNAIENGVIDQLVCVDVDSADVEAINSEALRSQKPAPITIIRTGQAG